MKLYNTLTGQLEKFEPLNGNKVTMYVCGPTVYDYPHLGHARCYITWDTVVRYLRYKGYKVKYVRNITDVDDKIIKKAKETNSTPSDIAQKYYEEFQNSMKALNVAEPDKEPKATENIQEMINIAQALIDKGYAYEVDGDVYFRVKKYNKYGELGKKNVEDLEAGSRVGVSEQKENPLDFALWKSVKNDSEISWDSPWGKGRPGWHIECSAMSEKYLGKTIDIHAGGLDLVFPHHENERAQSECAFGHTFVKYWLHNGFVLTNKEKMSKSLGNFVTIDKLLEKFDANTIRFFILTNHYRTPVDFNEEGLLSAKAGVRNLQNAVNVGAKFTDKPVTNYDYKLVEDINKFEEAMDEDFNTSEALAYLFSLVKRIHKSVEENNQEKCGIYLLALLKLSSVLGFNFENVSSNNENLKIPVEAIEKKIEERRIAKQNKDWATADKIRDELKKDGIILKDEKDGTTSWEVID